MPSGTSPWSMKKDDLLAKLKELDTPVNSKLTVPELRSLLVEQLPEKERPGGLTKLTLAQLKEKGRAERIDVPEKAMRGLLMRLLRDSQAPTAEEMVSFGRYIGYKYAEVREDYLTWAVEELGRKGEACSPELTRLAHWAGRRKAEQGYPKVKSILATEDPEATASVPPPPKAVPSPRARIRSTRSITTPKTERAKPMARGHSLVSDSDYQMVTSPEETSTEEQIKQLEEQLGILRAARQGEKVHHGRE